jgi:uncharacterized protein (TIGR00369 family)
MMGFQVPNPRFAEDIKESFAKLELVEPGLVEITIAYRKELTQQQGYLHAGVVTTIADTAAGYAAYSLMPAASEVLSVEFKVNLLRPAKGVAFVARAEVIKPGKTLTVVRADVFGISETGARELVATLQGTMFCIAHAQGVSASEQP